MLRVGQRRDALFGTDPPTTVTQLDAVEEGRHTLGESRAFEDGDVTLIMMSSGST